MFIKYNPDSLYQNTSRALGSSMKMDYPSSKTRDAIFLLVEKIEQLEKEIIKLKTNGYKTK